MTKLAAVGIIAAGVLGGSLQAGAGTAVYEMTNGTFSDTEAGCSQAAYTFSTKDCSYGRNREGSTSGWDGPWYAAAHYALGAPQASLTYVPTAGAMDEDPPGSLIYSHYVAPVSDGKFAATVTGTLSINDNNTPGNANAADDIISATFAIGPMARNVVIFQAPARTIQSWTSMDHVMAPITVSSATTNADGGVDYVIGSRGFPAQICVPASTYPTNPLACLPTQYAVDANQDKGFTEASLWTTIPVHQVGIERSGLMGNPDLVDPKNPPQPPANPPAGNVGATSTATFVGGTCVTQVTRVDQDCSSNALVWGSTGEDAGFDNIIMKVSTNAAGAITSALAYYTQESRTNGLGNPPLLYDNALDFGTFSFTAPAPSVGPDARNFSASVIQGSSGNTLDTVANCVNFPGQVTVSIVSGPTLGTATVNANQTINYNAPAGAGTGTLVYQCTSDATSDQGTITITVEADTAPVAPDGAISISTQGAAPAGTPGNVNVSSLQGPPAYAPGNSPSVVSVSTPPDPTKGTTAVTGTTITFTPAANFFEGTATFGYTITDGNLDSDSGEIIVTIANVVPILGDGSITTEQDRASLPLSLAITPGNGSVAQSPVTVTTAATSGTCAVTGTAAAPTLTYTPAAGYFGPDSCGLTITDGDGSTDAGTFSITVTEVDDALQLPGGSGALDLWSLSLLGALPLLQRRCRRRA